MMFQSGVDARIDYFGENATLRAFLNKCDDEIGSGSFTIQKICFSRSDGVSRASCQLNTVTHGGITAE